MSLQQFACRCLNLTITPAPRPDAAPGPTPATHYAQVYVGDAGIHVVSSTRRASTEFVPTVLVDSWAAYDAPTHDSTGQGQDPVEHGLVSTMSHYRVPRRERSSPRL